MNSSHFCKLPCTLSQFVAPCWYSRQLSSSAVCATCPPVRRASVDYLPAPYECLALIPSAFAGRLVYPQPDDTPCCDGVKTSYTEQSEMFTKTIAYFFFRKRSHKKVGRSVGRSENERGLDISSQTVGVAFHGSRLSSSQLSLTCFREEGYAPFWACVLTVEFNQSTNIKTWPSDASHSAFSSQVDGSAIHVYPICHKNFTKWLLCFKLSQPHSDFILKYKHL